MSERSGFNFNVDIVALVRATTFSSKLILSNVLSTVCVKNIICHKRLEYAIAEDKAATKHAERLRI